MVMSLLTTTNVASSWGSSCWLRAPHPCWIQLQSKHLQGGFLREAVPQGMLVPCLAYSNSDRASRFVSFRFAAIFVERFAVSLRLSPLPPLRCYCVPAALSASGPVDVKGETHCAGPGRLAGCCNTASRPDVTCYKPNGFPVSFIDPWYAAFSTAPTTLDRRQTAFPTESA